LRKKLAWTNRIIHVYEDIAHADAGADAHEYAIHLQK
jgi:hypothetical protein